MEGMKGYKVQLCRGFVLALWRRGQAGTHGHRVWACENRACVLAA